MVELIVPSVHNSFRVNLAVVRGAWLIIKTPLLQMASIAHLPGH
jgi:hypothetical protein